MTMFWWWVIRIYAMINVIAIAFLVGRGEYGEGVEDDDQGN